MRFVQVGARLRVCYFGTYRAAYTRNVIMIDGLRRSKVEVIECHEPLWRGIEDRVHAASGGWLRPAFWLRVVRTYARLVRRFRSVPAFDVMVLGYPGQADVLLARLLCWLRRRPFALDCFMSIYLVACERELAPRHWFTGRLIYWLEKLTLRLPDLLIAMTDEYVEWFGDNLGLAPERFRVVPTGADDQVYRPIGPRTQDQAGAAFTVLYYGTFIQTHGVLTIVEAAQLLADQVRFVLVGQGPLRDEAIRRAGQYGLSNVEFVDWVDREQLPALVAQADLCLGVFGTTPQVEITVQNKIYEGLAMAKPVLTASARTVRRLFRHREHLYLCQPDNPEALARAILDLRDDPELRMRLARNGREMFLSSFTPQAVGELFRRHLEEMVAGRTKERG